jgi:hypothetical protein
VIDKAKKGDVDFGKNFDEIENLLRKFRYAIKDEVYPFDQVVGLAQQLAFQIPPAYRASLKKLINALTEAQDLKKKLWELVNYGIDSASKMQEEI